MREIERFNEITTRLERATSPTKETRQLANTIIRSADGTSSFLAAVSMQRFKDIKLFLKHGADIQTTNINGLTVLHAIAMYGRKDMGGDGFKFGSNGYEITMLLLEHGADASKLSNNGWLPERFVLEPRTGTTRQNTEDHRDFVNILETFQAQQLQKQTERKSSDETIATARLSFGSGDGDHSPRTQVASSGLLHHRHAVYRDSGAKDTDERQALLPSKQVDSSSNTGIGSWLYSMVVGTPKESESKSK